MTRGRKSKTPLEELRARWWYRAVARAVRCMENLESVTPYGLGQVLKHKGVWATEESRQWYHYEKGERSPSDAVLNAVEESYPHTRRVFEDGPNFSYLWKALVGDPRIALSQTQDEWQHGVQVEHVTRVPDCRIVNDNGEIGRVAGLHAVQDVVIPRELARRWGLTSGMRLNLAEKLQPWEHIDDLCGSRIFRQESEVFFRHTAAVLLSSAPPATATIEERLKAPAHIKLPYFAGLAYQIAQARLDGRKKVVLPPWDRPEDTFEKEKTSEDEKIQRDQAAEMFNDFARVSGLKFLRG